MMTTADRWKRLLEPLSSAMRRRLEIGIGVVVTGAAIVGLSTVIPPDPSKLASKNADPTAPTSVDHTEHPERSVDVQLRAELPSAPRVAPDFARAVAAGDLEAMERLLAPGMPLDGMLALAAGSGDKPVAIWLLDHGADVHEEEGTIDAPILRADEHPELVALLLARGEAEPLLATAAQANAPNAVLRLLAAHAPVDPIDSAPLTSAVSSTKGTNENRMFIVEKLLAAGANPNRDDLENPLTAAVHACDETMREEHAAPNDCVPIIKVLVKHGARTRGDALAAVLALGDPAQAAPLDAVLAARVERGATAIALASVSVPASIVKRLTAKGIDWTWRDGEEDAALPLLAAVQRGDRDYVRALLDAGAPANFHYKDGTCALGEAIDNASRGGGTDYARIVELLVARGADVNRRLPDGRTPLFAAAEGGELRVVTALLDGGARVNDLVLDDTALDVAEQNAHQPAARVLHAHGARRARKSGSTRGDGE